MDGKAQHTQRITIVQSEAQHSTTMLLRSHQLGVTDATLAYACKFFKQLSIRRMPHTTAYLGDDSCAVQYTRVIEMPCNIPAGRSSYRVSATSNEICHLTLKVQAQHTTVKMRHAGGAGEATAGMLLVLLQLLMRRG